MSGCTFVRLGIAPCVTMVTCVFAVIPNSYSPKRGIMFKEDGTPYNAGKDDWNEVPNVEILKEVRKSMMKGEWHPECERCRQEEVNGIRSRREYENDDWGKWFGDISLEKVLPHTKEDGSIDAEN